MMSLWDALRMNMMISYQELVRTFLNILGIAVAAYVAVNTNKWFYEKEVKGLNTWSL
ncbi:hypothetical protein JRC19_14035 [Escherichia coli]|nr:hypothetical protein [Escherichia coli]